ncbi:MAG: hypothetical protein F4078_07505 [Acidimicrobiia bacterium]|nr:hypothetical protein [Acidimicrobiia bacterium]MYJ14130.1 hypothetical protein [Acidimicrobiia bacterium]
MVPAASLPGAEAGGEDPAPDAGVELWAAEPDADDAFVPPWWVGYDTLLAVVAFVALFRFWGLGPAIGAITVISLLSGVLRVRSGVGVGKLLPLVTIGVVARGVVGILTDNDDIYFGIGIGYKFAIAAALMLSAPLKLNPATDLVARTLGLPALVCSHEAYRSAVDRIIVVFGLLLGAAAGFDIWFLGVTDPDEYVLFRYLINWPLYVGFTTLSLLFLSRRLGRIPGFPGLMNLLEQQAEARTAARKRR